MKKGKADDSAFKAPSIPVAILLIIVVLLSAVSGFAGASLFAQQVPNVTTTIYTTTTNWTTSTVWSTVTSVAYGVWTTVQYTTSTSTVTVSTSSSTATSPAIVGTGVTITQVIGLSGRVTVQGVLRDASGKGLQGLQVRVTVDGGYTGRVITGTGGSFAYAGPGPTAKGSHVVAVWFDKTTQYAASAASRSYSL